MTRTISFIIGIAVVALVAVPTALAKPVPASNGEDAVMFFYANERATLAEQRLDVVSRPDSHEVNRPLSYLDGPERSALFSQQPRSETVLLSGDDHVTTPVADEPAPTASGRDIDWPQIGIGFGIGIVLAIVLGLSLKATRPRTLAH